ncbi:MAG: FAD-dependent oxidoreductase [Gammaproteobacteria bacterium]|nr:FAD-dependent oxidoreductase [Gammaproteobacteria bacterium]
MDPIIIIGTGVAGYTLAREFRKLDTEQALIMISSDDGRNYPKPMLSNALTKGKTADQVAMSDAGKMAETLSATIMTEQTVVKIDRQNKSLILASGEAIKYNKLVLAVGAEPVRLKLEGDAADAALSVNNLNDYTAFRSKLATAKHVAIIGSGLIGCEFANDLGNVGIAVSVIGPSEVPMNSLLPRQIAIELQQALTNIGVNWHLGTTATAINSVNDQYDVRLGSGESVVADLVVSAVGLKANIKLAQSAALVINRGIVTDRYLQTSDPNIYAIGDCAEVSGHHLMYIAPTLLAAKALAQTLTGAPMIVNYPAMPVAVKTPSYPLIICPPPINVEGSCQLEHNKTGSGIKGLFFDENGVLLGFVLSGDMISQKQVYIKMLPDLLSSIPV